MHSWYVQNLYLFDERDSLPVPPKYHSVLFLEHVEVALGDVLHGNRDIIGEDSNQAAWLEETDSKQGRV